MTTTIPASETSEPTIPPIPPVTLEQRVARLAAARIRRDHYKNEIAEGRKTLDITLNQFYGEDMRQLVLFEQLVSTEDAALRAEAEDAYCETGNKHPVPGVEVKDTRSYSYDPIQAVAWAKIHGHDDLLKIDARAFEKLASVVFIPGVLCTITPRANVAKELPLPEERPNAL